MKYYVSICSTRVIYRYLSCDLKHQHDKILTRSINIPAFCHDVEDYILDKVPIYNADSLEIVNKFYDSIKIFESDSLIQCKAFAEKCLVPVTVFSNKSSKVWQFNDNKRDYF